jgi:hypothetical protein
MKHISDLFSRYKNTIQPPQSSIIKEFIVVCEEVSKIKVKLEQCTYTVSTKTLYLQTHSLIKSELLLKKTDLLKALKKRLGKNSPTEIL